MEDDIYEDSDSHINKYNEEAEKLLELIAEREKHVELLKYARPEKIAAIRKYIVGLDGVIESTEKIMEIHLEAHRKRLKLDKMLAELETIGAKVERGLLKYVAENKPEKLEEIKAMLSDDDKSH
jgi:hypothetical protein